ncbi:MAG: hypothetical protein ACYDDA_14370, partial [Acidiferrobacteraceae bacterium]
TNTRAAMAQNRGMAGAVLRGRAPVVVDRLFVLRVNRPPIQGRCGGGASDSRRDVTDIVLQRSASPTPQSFGIVSVKVKLVAGANISDDTATGDT